MTIGEWVGIVGLVFTAIGMIGGLLKWVVGLAIESFKKEMAATRHELGDKIEEVSRQNEKSLRVIERHEARLDDYHDRLIRLEISTAGSKGN